MIDSSVYLTFSDYLINPWSLGLFQIVVSSSFLSMTCIREREFARERDSIYLQVYVHTQQSQRAIMLPINVHATDLWDMLWLFILNSACFNAINQQEKMKRGDNAFMLLTTVCSVYVMKQCRQWIHDTHCTTYRLLMYATYVINLWYMLSNDDACSTWSWSIRMLINMILVTRFIDAVNNNFTSTFYICGLSMFWTYYMTVMFIFLLYIKDLRECYCECQNQCSRHDQLSLEAKWTSKHHHHHHHAFRLHR